MALTKQDLQQIRTVVREEVRTEVTASEDRMMAQIKASEERTTDRLGTKLGGQIEELAGQIEELAEGQRFIMEEVSKVTSNHEQRITKLEHGIGLVSK